MHFATLLTLSVLGFAEIRASPTSPTPVYLQKNCNHDNLFRSFLDKRYTSSATAFCSKYVVPVVTSTRTVTPTETITRSTASTRSVTQLSTKTAVVSKTYTGTSTKSTETDLLTKSTQTSTVVISTETDIATLSTELQTSTIETDYITVSTDVSYSVVQTDTVTITLPAVASTTVLVAPKRRSPENIEERAVTSPLASGWIATYGASRVSSACKCIITKAASTSTVYTTKTACKKTTTLTIRQSPSKTTSLTTTKTQTSSATLIINVTLTTTKYITASTEKDVTATETKYITLTSVIPTTLLSSVVGSLTLPSTTTTTTSTTSAAPTPPGACTDLPSPYFSGSERAFDLSCGYLFGGGVAVRTTAPNFKGCLDACANFDQCLGALYYSLPGFDHECDMYTRINTGNGMPFGGEGFDVGVLLT